MESFHKRSKMEYPPLMSEVNLMLLGMTGSGKSASGNTIIGGNRKPFKEVFSPASVTRVCQSAQSEVDGQTNNDYKQTITVIDTVGLSDTDVKITDAQTQIETELQRKNLDVFLLVIKLGEAFTKEKTDAVKWIQDHFGAKLLKHTLVLFTHGDQLRVSIERYMSECITLRSVVDQCSGGYHVFNNKDEDPSQVTELLDKINKLREKNGNRRYTERDYAEAQKDLLLKKCAKGAAVGGVGGAVAGAAGGAAATELGAIALTVGIGAAGGAVLLAAAAGAGVYFLARKYNPSKKDKSE